MSELVSLLIIVGVVLVVFLIAREFWCWYFKINYQNEILAEQNKILKDIFVQLGGQMTDDTELSIGKLNSMLRDGAITKKEYDAQLKRNKNKGIS